MSPPPPKKTLSKEDVPGAPAWVEGLFGPLNAFILPTTSGLDRGLTFRENFAGEVRTVDLVVPDDWTPMATVGAWIPATGGRQASRWRKLSNGDVQVQLAVQRLGAPGGIEPIAVGLPPADGVYSFPCVTPGGYGSMDVNPSGQVVYTAGGSSLFISNAQYTAIDRTPARWAAPVDVRLGSPQKPFPGKPGQVMVLSAMPKASLAGPSMVSGWDITPINLSENSKKPTPGIRIHNVWGLLPRVAYTLTLAVFPE